MAEQPETNLWYVFQNIDDIVQPSLSFLYYITYVGRLLWAGSSSRIQVPAVPLLDHEQHHMSSNEKENSVNSHDKRKNASYIVVGRWKVCV